MRLRLNNSLEMLNMEYTTTGLEDPALWSSHGHLRACQLIGFECLATVSASKNHTKQHN